MNHATVEVDLWSRDKDEGRTIIMPTKTEIVPTDILLGDGNAEAGREFSMRIAGGDYNAVVLSTTASVKIRCNQDDESIDHALKACEKIIKKTIADYKPKMQAMLEELVTESS
jgi:hypothetical protein